MHIYAFGSICRGDISQGSDIDLLAIVEGYNAKFDPDKFSIYSYERIQELWQEGNPFAWHLSLEARLIFSSDQRDYLKELGSPAPYKDYVRDCIKFLTLFQEAYSSVLSSTTSQAFDMSTIFLSIRNIATCFSLGTTCNPTFSRNSALHLGAYSIPIPLDSYIVFERSRILCVRGYGETISDEESNRAMEQAGAIQGWMSNLIKEAKRYERIQQPHSSPKANSSVS